MIEKLDQLTKDGNFRAKVQSIIEILQIKGFKDTYIVEGMRTLAQQKEKVRKGVSKTLNSYHLKRGTDGKGLAADIVPKSKGWNASKRFWMIQGWLTHIKGIGWGGLFGLSLTQQRRLLENMQKLSEAKWPANHELYETAIGWDPAHIQKDNNWKV